jgi:hypothetical protein
MHTKTQPSPNHYITTEKDSILHRYFITLERQQKQQQTQQPVSFG